MLIWAMFNNKPELWRKNLEHQAWMYDHIRLEVVQSLQSCGLGDKGWTLNLGLSKSRKECVFVKGMMGLVLIASWREIDN